jgi:hypothetical protein
LNVELSHSFRFCGTQTGIESLATLLLGLDGLDDEGKNLSPSEVFHKFFPIFMEHITEIES